MFADSEQQDMKESRIYIGENSETRLPCPHRPGTGSGVGFVHMGVFILQIL